MGVEPECSLFSFNIPLRRPIENYLGKQYVGNKADQRPDLLLNENLRFMGKNSRVAQSQIFTSCF
jgi:hypothetical protein